MAHAALRLLKIALLPLMLATAAVAQEFPSRPIRIVVGFAPGGSNDVIGRIVASKLTERLGKQVIVDNRPGASGVVASEIVAAAPPDGHTLMVVSIAHTANPSLFKLKYDTEKAFAPVAQLGAGSSVLVAHPSLPAASVKELIELARKMPGKLHMAFAGNGTYQHMASSSFLTMAGIDVVLVPFKGGGPALIDVVAGHSQLLIVSMIHVSSHIKAGKLKAFGVTSDKRNEHYPDLPTVAEAGLPGYESENWWGVVGPAGMPRPIVDKLAAEIAIVQDQRELRETLEKEGAWPIKRASAEFGKHLSAEIAKWAKVIKDGNIKMQ